MNELNRLLRSSIKNKLTSLSKSLGWIEEIHRRYRHLDRSRVNTQDLLDLKLSVIRWRSKLLQELIENPPIFAIEQTNNLKILLDRLNNYIPEHLKCRLARLVDRETNDYLLAKQGIHSKDFADFSTMAGPGLDLKIVANRNSRWPFNKWSRYEQFTRYDYEGDGVNFRGVQFRPGDVLLANVNLDGNGIYTTLSDPIGFSSHSAFFAVLEENGQRFPSVIETYEKGVRAVPLNIFLGPNYCSYVEIYRTKALTSQHTAAINHLAREIMLNVKGYNFDSEDTDRTWMSCASVGRFLYLDAGLEPAQSKSRIQVPAIQENLRSLGYTFFEFFAPVDYLLDKNFHCVGWVDNNQFTYLLARELVNGYFRELFSWRKLNPKKFPFRRRLNYWGINHIRRQTLIGKIISWVEGFDQHTLPKGPDRLLSVITVAEAQIGRSIVKTREWLEQQGVNSGSFELNDYRKDPDVRAFLERTLHLPWLI